VVEHGAQSKTLAESAWRKLRGDILQGRRKPGEKLHIERLSAAYGVGPTPLREALSRLSSVGLVTAEGQRGFRVAPVSVENLLDVSRNRVWMEALALRSAMARGDRAWEAGIVAAAHRLRGLPSHSAKGVAPDWDRENRLFHEALVAACDSPQLLAIREHLYDMSDRYRRLAVLDGMPGRDVDDEHDAIMGAVVDRKANRAIDLLAEHFLATTRAVLDAYVAREAERRTLMRTLRRDIEQGLGR
jgi:GntR family carbon starvation induced transcriptional regulator